MVNDILIGITNALNAQFSTVPIYTDNVEQGLEQPCFFVMPISSIESPLINRRAKRSVIFSIHYLSEAGRMHLEDMAADLYPILRKIDLLDGSSLLGFNLNHEIVDDVLHFSVSFKPTILYEGAKTETMGGLEYAQGVKND